MLWPFDDKQSWLLVFLLPVNLCFTWGSRNRPSIGEGVTSFQASHFPVKEEARNKGLNPNIHRPNGDTTAQLYKVPG